MTPIEIRKEIATDQLAISQITKKAFQGRPYAGGDEQEVIDRLRDQGALTLSLVALDGSTLIGQITFSPANLGNEEGAYFALGPVAVDPSRQGEGIGSMLIEAGLQQIKEIGGLGCILTGNPDYYSRFGFELSPSNCPPHEPEQYFQLKLLGETMPVGKFAFHKAFYGETRKI